MDPKAHFIEQIRQRELREASGRILQKQNIETFQSRVSALLQRIQYWLHDVEAVRVTIAPMMLFDEALVERSMNRTYPIDCMTIVANDASLWLRPEALQGASAKGRIGMAFYGVRNAPVCQLLMEEAGIDHGEWALVTTTMQKNRPVREIEPFTEAAFFTLMNRVLHPAETV